MDCLLKTFREASGLKVHHCLINPDFALEFDGLNRDGSIFHIVGRPFPRDLHAEAKLLGILQRNRVIESIAQEINYGANVTEQSKGKAFAERLKKFRTDHAADLDEREKKYDSLVAKRAELSQRMDSMESADRAELDAIDAELRQMGNDL